MVRRVVKPRHARLALAAVAAVVLSIVLSRGVFEGFRRKHAPDATYRRISGIVAHNSRMGVAAYWSFDRGENCAPERGIGVGTVCAPGVSGDALFFDGHDDTFFATGLLWQPRGDFSVSMWLKAEALPIRQDVVFQGRRDQIGFRIDSGNLVFDLPSTNGVASFSCPFTSFGKFVHVAAVVEPSAGVVSLYVGGVRQCAGALCGLNEPDWDVNIGRCALKGKHNAFRGALDELVLWDRALDGDEIAMMAGSPRGTRTAALKGGRRLRIAKYRFLSAVAGAMDRIAGLAETNPVRHFRARRERRNLRRVDIVLKKGALRRLLGAHASSVASGHRTPAATRSSRGHVMAGGHGSRCRISLCGGTLSYPESGRMPFVLETEDGEGLMPGGVRRVILMPPESGGWLTRLAESEAWRLSGLPNPPPATELVSLGINGHSVGVYLMSDASRMLVQAGEDMNPLAHDAKRPLDPMREAECSRLAPQKVSGRIKAAMDSQFSEDAMREYERRVRTAADLFMCDGHSPLPAAKRAETLAESLAGAIAPRTPAAADSFLLDEDLLLGGNRAPWLVNRDLDFSGVRVPDGWSLSFRSEAPEWIGDDGRIVKRPEKRPEFVTITATVTDAAGGSSVRSLEFRLAPEAGAVPALFIWTPVRFGRTHRTDAAVELVDPRQPGLEPAAFTATAAGGPGGVRYRGNSSFISGKKLLNVKLDVPHGLFGATDTRSLLAINSYADPMRIWNGFAFSLFRSFPRSDGKDNVAPHVKLFEVFCNGRYCGLQEFAERIDWRLLGDNRAAVFRHMTVAPRDTFVRQTSPDPCDADALGIYSSLIENLEREPTEESVAAVLGALDVDSAIDYQILYSLLANSNGSPYNYWTHDAIAYRPSSGMLEFIPWDFDNGSDNRHKLVENKLDKWLEANVPGYLARRSARWSELRKTVLREDALVDAFDSLLDVHFDYLPSNRRRWPNYARKNENFEQMREQDREFLRSQLMYFDEEFAE